MAMYARRSPGGDLVCLSDCARQSDERDWTDSRFGLYKGTQEEDSTDGGSCSSDLESATSGSLSARTCGRQSIPIDRLSKSVNHMQQTNSLRHRGAAVLSTFAKDVTTDRIPAGWNQQYSQRVANGNCVPILSPRGIASAGARAERRYANSAMPSAFEYMPAKVRPSVGDSRMHKSRLNPHLPAKKFPCFFADFPNMTLKSQQFDSHAPLKKGVTSFLSSDVIFVGMSEHLWPEETAPGCVPSRTNVLGTQSLVSPRYGPSR
jgi:hypothetical protein